MPKEPAKPEETAPKAEKAPAELRPVEQWRELLMPDETPANRHARRDFVAAHAVAEVVHGWSDERRNYARSVVLTENDYRAALKASGQCDDYGATCVHKPAFGTSKRQADEARKA